MPSEIDLDSFLKLAEKVESCKVKRVGDVVKLKLRGSNQLYTVKISKNKAEEIIKELPCKVVEV